MMRENIYSTSLLSYKINVVLIKFVFDFTYLHNIAYAFQVPTLFSLRAFKNIFIQTLFFHTLEIFFKLELK